MSESKQSHQNGGYGALLADRSFESFLWTQFFGAFNDNVYKMIVSVGAIEFAANQLLGARYLALAGAVFVLPFLLFAGYAGQIADRFSKTRVLQITKSFEIFIMLCGIAALSLRSVNLLLFVLFLLAFQANLFSPAKYGILPEMLDEAQLSRANGLLEFSTFAAIILGTSAGTIMFARWKNEPLLLGGILLGVAVLGSLTSLLIQKVPSAGSREPFHWNPFAEVWTGTTRIYRNRAQWLTVTGISYFWFIGALFQLAVILLGQESLHLSETRIGLLVTALAAGIGVGSLLAGWISGDRIEIGLVPLGGALLGVSSIFLGSAHTFQQAAFWLASSGFFGGLFIVPLNAFLQEYADPREKGRVLAANNFMNAIGMVIASGLLFLLHDLLHWSPSNIIAAVGALTLLLTVYIAWLIPAPLARFVIASAMKIFFRIRIIGSENLPKQGGALIVSNHVTYADALLIGCISPRLIRFLMWQPMYENKWLNPVCRLFGAIPLAQGSPKDALRSLRQAHADLATGQWIGIFPEGELTKTAQVGPFERGVELIARGLDSTPIIPVYLDGLWGHALSVKGGAAFRSRLCLRHPVTISIGEPIIGKVDAAQMRDHVLALGSKARETRKTDSTTLSRRLIGAARARWSSVALADSSGKQLRFGETLTASLLLSRWIKQNRSQTSNVGILLPASVGGALANLGVTLAGKTAVNLNFTAGKAQMEHVLETCGINTVVCSRVFLEKAKLTELPGTVYLEDLLLRFSLFDKLLVSAQARFMPVRFLNRASADDTAAIIFSSGSTGTPKGVMLSHWNLIANAEATGEVYTVGHEDCILGALPFFHSFGYTYTLWFPLLHGFKAVYHANPVDAKVIGELAGEHHPTLFLSTPTFCLAYLRKCTREQFSSIRHLLVGAEKLRPALAEAFEKKFGVTLLEGYGCTEMGPAVSVNVAGRDSKSTAYKSGSVGRPLPNVSARIVDPETFAPRAIGETGLLLVNGPSRMKGYFGDEKRTAAALRDGYYVTGDLAFLDADGFLHIVDRLSRFSKIAGEMVPHLKIEDALAEVAGNGNCAVTGVPDEQRGERLAVIYCNTSVTPAQMIQHLERCGLPALWIPKRNQFCLVDAIPLLGTGKTDLVRVKTIAQNLGVTNSPVEALAP